MVSLRNVLLATFASTIGFWAWAVVGPLAKITRAKQMHLDAGMTQPLPGILMPIFIAIGLAYSVGGLTATVVVLCSPLFWRLAHPGAVGVAGRGELAPMLLVVALAHKIAGYRARCGYSRPVHVCALKV